MNITLQKNYYYVRVFFFLLYNKNRFTEKRYKTYIHLHIYKEYTI